ncbi:MAG TPA: hypothetical protein VH008_07070 [Pseudonocardia sp.]|jgi:hypothetical protein|nr:hypothetical protein [Pseudonocardia sp.]
MRTIRIETELPTGADRVFDALRHPASFNYVTRGVIGFPALAGRTEPYRDGERGRGWMLLFHVIPVHRHTIELVELDAASRTLRSREHGGLLRTWNHTLHVEPSSPDRCRYSDTVQLDAGPLTGPVAAFGVWFYGYRQRRWLRLVRKHLLPEGTSYRS